MADTTANVFLGLNVNEFRKGIQQVDSSLKGMSQQLNNLGGLIGASFAVSHIQQFAQESVDLALKAQGVAAAFERIGNEANLQQMRSQIKGTVNDLDLMQQAVKAENLGIPIQDFTKYLSYAKKQATELGTSVDYMVESIVTGVGRQSALILDNLGISATELNQELAKGGTYAEAVGRIIERSMGEAGEQVLTTKDRIDAQRASIENLQTAIGENLLPIYEAMLNFVAEGFKAINHLMSNQLTLWEKLAYLASYANVTGGAATRVMLDALAAQRKAMQDVTLEAPKMGEGLKMAADSGTDGLKKTNKEADKFVDRLSSMLALARQFAEQDLNFVAKGEVLDTYKPIDIEEVDLMEGELVPLIAKVNETGDALRAAAMVGQQFGSVLSEAFSASIVNGENFFEVLKKALMDYVKQMAVALATTTALAAVFSAVTGGGFGAAFGAVSQGTGLGGLFGEGGLLQLGATVKGSDLQLGTQRSGSNFRRSGGG
jgi:hypothetical protein